MNVASAATGMPVFSHSTVIGPSMAGSATITSGCQCRRSARGRRPGRRPSRPASRGTRRPAARSSPGVRRRGARARAPAPTPRRPAGRGRPEALALDRRPAVLAGVERHLVAALAQRARHGDVRVDVARERPAAEQEASAHGALAASRAPRGGGRRATRSSSSSAAPAGPGARASRSRQPLRALAVASVVEHLAAPPRAAAPACTPAGARRTPAPASMTRRALSGLSCAVGTTTSGTPARSAAMTVALPPPVTTAAQRGSSAPWLIQRVDVHVGRQRCRGRARSGSRWPPVVMITSSGAPASPRPRRAAGTDRRRAPCSR